MKKFSFTVNLLIIALPMILSIPLTAKDKAYIPGIGPIGEIKKVQGDFQFTEGTAADIEGNLYFTDIPANRIYKLSNDGKISVFIEPSAHANGLMVVNKHKLLACQMDGQLVSIDLETKEVNVLSVKYQEVRFNAPNDLVVDKTGGVYFTDPRYRAPEPWPQGIEAVYYRNADGVVSRLVENLKAPNGIILSPDRKTLYVIPTMQKEMWAYPVKAPGKLGEGNVFCVLTQPKREDNTGGDGLTVDTKGNLYITSKLGVQVFNPEGELLGIIEFSEQPANVTFGGPDMKTLYVTARTSLYSTPMEAVGYIFYEH